MFYKLNMTIPHAGDTVRLICDTQSQDRLIPSGSIGTVMSVTQHVEGEGRYVYVGFDGVPCLVHEDSLRITSNNS